MLKEFEQYLGRVGGREGREEKGDQQGGTSRKFLREIVNSSLSLLFFSFPLQTSTYSHACNGCVSISTLCFDSACFPSSLSTVSEDFFSHVHQAVVTCRSASHHVRKGRQRFRTRIRAVSFGTFSFHFSQLSQVILLFPTARSMLTFINDLARSLLISFHGSSRSSKSGIETHATKPSFKGNYQTIVLIGKIRNC